MFYLELDMGSVCSVMVIYIVLVLYLVVVSPWICIDRNIT